MARRIVSLLFAFSLTALASLIACGGPDRAEMERKVSSRANPGSFRGAGVTTVFEKRCGSLDCHGDRTRNLIIYSSNGLRLPNDAGLKPGAGATTIDEITANYQSLMTLEPEITNAVLAGGDPYSLLMLKKPLELEKHKGGAAIRKGDDAERCILTWLKEEALTDPVDKVACGKASIFPKE